jgi:hypothetical protein
MKTVSKIMLGILLGLASGNIHAMESTSSSRQNIIQENEIPQNSNLNDMTDLVLQEILSNVVRGKTVSTPEELVNSIRNSYKQLSVLKRVNKWFNAFLTDDKIFEILIIGLTEKDVNLVDTDGLTPLHRAVCKGFAEEVKLLLRAGAVIDKADMLGFTPLHWAVYGDHTEIVKLLIEAGAGVYREDNYGATPLQFAALYGYTEIIELLIGAGAVINCTADADYETPLYFAVHNGHRKAAERLVALGAAIPENLISDLEEMGIKIPK